jgi:hypothetical protein
MGLKVMLTFGVAHAVTSCDQEVTASTATMAVEVLALMYLFTTTWIELWSASPWVAAAPGAGDKVKKAKSSSRHGILRPVNLSNPNAQTVLTTNDALIQSRVVMYSGGGGGGTGGVGSFDWYTGIMHVNVFNSGPSSHMLEGTFLSAIIPGHHFFGGFASLLGPSSISLFRKFSMSDVRVTRLAGYISSLFMRTDSSSAEQVYRVGSAWHRWWSVNRFGFL